VNSSRALRWYFALLLFLSVAWKLAIPPENSNDLKDELIKFFERNHFSVAVIDANYTQTIHASMPSCRLRIAELRPDGSNRNLIRDLARGADHVFVVFRGAVYKGQPTFSTMSAYLWSRFLRELGLRKHITPVIAVATNSACDAERLPWGELR
jgi:hypothetical protein